MTPPGQITLSPDSRPIFTLIDAYEAVIAAEWARMERLPHYDPRTAEAHEEWNRLHAEGRRRILDFGPLGAAAIRAGRLAGEAARTGELVRRGMDIIRGLEGWVSAWWDRHGDGYRAWRERHWPPNPEGIVTRPGACTEMPPEYIEKALALLRPADQALSALTNDLHVIAIAVPMPPTARPPEGELPEEAAASRAALPDKASPRGVKGKRIDERMLAAIRDDSEAVYLSAQQWAGRLQCAKSTVQATRTWRTVCVPAGERERLSRGKRLRGPRGRNSGRP